MFPKRHDIDHPAHPMSDEQTMAQVIEPAKQIAKAAGLQDVSGGFHMASCNDQGDPPYQGVVEMSFKMPIDERNGYPAEVDPDTYFDQIARSMVAQGWHDGPPPGYHAYGRILHRDGVIANVSSDPNSGRGSIDLRGECRNMTDHRGTPVHFNITDQLPAG
jgi:hypothetical protein